MTTIEVEKDVCFTSEDLSNEIQRIFIDVPVGSINIDKLNTCFRFMESAEMPLIMKCLNALVFQSLSDPFFTLTECQKKSLEELSLFLIDSWIAESTVQKN